MTMTGPIELNCPSCGTKFKSFRLLSNTVLGMYTDFRRKSAGADPTRFFVHSCLHCAFTGPDEWFRSPVPAKVKRLIRENLTPLSEGAVREQSWLKYEYTATIAQWLASPPEEIASYYLNAAYICAVTAQRALRKQERGYRRKAIEFFVEALESGRVPEKTVPQTTYLVGELYRRVGSKENAIAWLERAEKLASPHEDLAWLAELALQQRTRPRNMMPDSRAGGRNRR
jgi:uncharacterized protein (DUF2225 family)